MLLIKHHADQLDLNQDSRYLLASAYFRVVAPVLTVDFWAAGAAIVMPSPSFDPHSVVRAIQDHGITDVLLVPFHLHALTKDDSFAPEKMVSIKHAMFGGDMITKEILRKGRSSFPNAKISVGHGMTGKQTDRHSGT